jgi:hypothetical protein
VLWTLTSEGSVGGITSSEAVQGKPRARKKKGVSTKLAK